MNVLLISREYPPETAWGGIATYMYHLAHGLCGRGHRVRVLSQSINGRRVEADENGVTVTRIAHGGQRRVPRRHRLAALADLVGRSRAVAATARELLDREPADIVEGSLWDAETVALPGRRRPPLVVRAQTPHAEVARVCGLNRRWWAVNRRAAGWLESIAARRARGLELCRTRFSVESMVERTEAVYGEFIASRRCRPSRAGGEATNARAAIEVDVRTLRPDWTFEVANNMIRVRRPRDAA